MQSPLVTRRHHDAEVEALRSEIADLVDGLIEVSNDLTLTKQSLRDAVAALKGAQDRADSAERKADMIFRKIVPRHVEIPVPMWAATRPLNCAIEDNWRFHSVDIYIDVPGFAFRHAIDTGYLRQMDDAYYAVDIIAGGFGDKYGEMIQKQVRSILRKAIEAHKEKK
jgi:hypothetical protein